MAAVCWTPLSELEYRVKSDWLLVQWLSLIFIPPIGTGCTYINLSSGGLVIIGRSDKSKFGLQMTFCLFILSIN